MYAVCKNQPKRYHNSYKFFWQTHFLTMKLHRANTLPSVRFAYIWAKGSNKTKTKTKKNVNKPKKEKDCRRIKHKIEVETNGREKKVHAHLAQNFGCAEWCVCGGLVSVYVSARVFIAFHVSIIMVSFVGFSARSAQLAS